MPDQPLTRPPSIEVLVSHPELAEAIERLSRPVVTELARAEVERMRGEVTSSWPSLDQCAKQVRRAADAWQRQGLLPVINATGVLLHTNLGRAPLGDGVLSHIANIASGYSNLEYDLSMGQRGRRGIALERDLCTLAGSESALVVNNNAAAVVLALSAIAFQREVIISRGELVQIGGGFRIPEILARSGATLHEVGTTNKTGLSDYSNAMGDSTAALMKVHRSNFAQTGFVSEVSIAELVELGRQHGIPVIWDMGSGALYGIERFGITNEPTIEFGLRAGVDLVTASGDKLFGGPQAGLIFGRSELIEKLRTDSFYRAMRPDKLTLSGLEETIRAHRAGKTHEQLPLYQLLSVPIGELQRRAESIVDHVKTQGMSATVTETDDAVGGGSAPDLTIAGFGVRLVGLPVDDVIRILLDHETPVIATRSDNSVVIHLRTVFSTQDRILLDALAAINVKTGK